MKTIQQSEDTLNARRAHHRALEVLAARVGCKVDGLKLWRRLRQVECKLAGVAVEICNGTAPRADWEPAVKAASFELLQAFDGRGIPPGIWFNDDPRGHAIKLGPEVTIPDGMYRDWSGNGILAPLID